jgi:VCBS repeat-containing protein
MIHSKVTSDLKDLAIAKLAQLSKKIGNLAPPIPIPESEVSLQAPAGLPKSATVKSGKSHFKDEDQSDALLDSEPGQLSGPLADIGAPTEFAETSVVLAQASANGKTPEGGAAVVSDSATHAPAPGAASTDMSVQGLAGWGFVGLAGASAFAGTAGASSAAASPVGFSLSGSILLGKINNATGLTIEAFKADGTKLAGTSVVNANGTFSITVTENYTGAVLIRLKDLNPGPNYTDESTGQPHDLTTDLRAVVNVSGHGAITVSITPLTELAVRELLGDAGGDAGTAATVLGPAGTAAQVTAANDGVKAAFGLSGDIVTTTPVSVDDSAALPTATAAQKAYGQALAAIAGAETVQAISTGDVLKALSQGLVAGKLSQSSVDMLISGAQTADGQSGGGSFIALTTSIGTGLSGIHISSDTGIAANDFITQSAAQTVTATLSQPLAIGNTLWGSVDGGAHWADVSAFVSGTTVPHVSWTGVTLSGTNTIQFAQTANSVTSFTGLAKDVLGSVALQAYSLDQTAPVFSSAGGVSFAENASTLAYKAVATDTNLLTYSLAGTDAALFTIDSNSGVVSFNASPNVVSFNASPNFEAPADAGGNNVYELTITATDGAGNSGSHAVAITVTNVNEAPNALSSGTTASFAENGTGVAYTAAGTDPDAGTTLSYVLGGTDAARFNINSSTGAVTFKAAPNFEVPLDVGGNNVYDITVTSSDGSLSSAAQAVAITVTNVNEAPVITSAASASFAENGTGTAYTATATDQDAGATRAYSITGADSTLFNVDATSGAVTFKVAPNYEQPLDAGANNVYDIMVGVSDGTNLTPQAVAITVSNVNEVPTSVSIPTEYAVVGQAFSQSLATYFSDPDALDHLTFTSTALPSGLTLDAGTGLLHGTVTATGTQSVTVTATDAGGLHTSQTFTLNEVTAPVFSTITSNVAAAKQGDALTFNILLTEPVLVSGGTPDVVFSVGGQSITASYVSGSGTNTLVFSALASAGDSSSVGVTAIALNGATVTGSVSTQPLVTTSVGQVVSNFVVDNTAPVFTSAASTSYAENGTAAAYAAGVSDTTSVQYSLDAVGDAALFHINANTGAVSFIATPNFEAPASAASSNAYSLSVSATDALGHVSTKAVTINVTNVNEAPNALSSGAAASFAENGTGVAYTAAGTDPDAGTTLSYVLGGTDATRFNINSTTGAVTFKLAPNFEAPADVGGNNVYDITVTSSDGSLSSAAQAVAITVTNVNEAPVLTSGVTATLAENASGTVYTATATDQDVGNVVSYALGGADQLLFNLNSSTGAVTFKAAPNFEVPLDVGANNVYDITVTASDGLLSSAAQAVAITVTDVNEAPTSTTVTAPVVVVAQAYSLDVSSHFTDVDAGDHLSYAATSLPTGLSINATTGIISGTVAGTSHSTVTVTATDTAAHSTSQSFSVDAYTAPTLSSHIDNVTNFEVTSAIVLTSTENLAGVAGKSIHIINDVGTGFHGENTINTQDISVTDTAHISIVNNTITINPGFDLDFNNNYHIMVDAGAFVGINSHLDSIATATATDMNFGTVNPAALGATGAGVAAPSQAMVGSVDAMIVGHNWLDVEGTGSLSGSAPVPVALDMSTGNIAVVITDLGVGGIATNDFYVALNNFGAGDQIYFDNHGDNTLQRQGDFNQGIIAAQSNVAPTQVFTPVSATGSLGGQFDVTVAGSNAFFGTTDALKVLLGNVTYEPILYG